MKVTIWVKTDQLAQFNKLFADMKGSKRDTLTTKDVINLKFSIIPDIEMIQVQVPAEDFLRLLDLRHENARGVILG